MKIKIILLGLVGFLNGCVTDDFGCAQFPETGCRAVSDVYKETNEGLHDYRKSLNNKTEEEREGRGVQVVVSRSNKAINYVVPGDPVLTKPRILRALFKTWEDKEKDLHGGGYIYIRLRGSEWVITKSVD